VRPSEPRLAGRTRKRAKRGDVVGNAHLVGSGDGEREEEDKGGGKGEAGAPMHRSGVESEARSAHAAVWAGPRARGTVGGGTGRDGAGISEERRKGAASRATRVRRCASGWPRS